MATGCDEGPDAEIRVHCSWSPDENFLLREFTVKAAGKPVMTVNQRIGWDPVAKQFRSWEFDSEGGFGEGRWSQDGERRVVKETGVRPEGVMGSSTRVTVKTRPDLAHWTMFDQVIAGESIPGEGDVHAHTAAPPSPGIKPGQQVINSSRVHTEPRQEAGDESQTRGCGALFCPW